MPFTARHGIALAAVGLAAVGAVWQLRAVPDPAADETAATAAAVGVPVEAFAAAPPADRDALVRAVGLLKAGRPGDALQALNRIDRKDDGPVHLRAVVLSGRCLLAAGRLAEAERLFAYAADRRPDDADAHRGLAAVYYDTGAAADAERNLRRVAALDPADRRPWRALATQAIDLRHLPVAEEALREFLARSPPAAEAAAARWELAAVLAGQQRYAEALDAGGPADTPAAHATRAECLRALDRPAEAAAEVAAGLAAAPDDPRLLLERGMLAVAAGDDAAAAAAFERVLAADEHQKTARYQLALACQRLGRAADAARHQERFRETEALLKRVAELNTRAIDRPWDAGVRLELAEACRRMNRPDLAAMWEKAAAGCPPAGR
jgi:tetratricopeptide (TPR) repeat protein